MQVATLEAAITFLQHLVPGRPMTVSSAYTNPDLVHRLSVDKSRSGMHQQWLPVFDCVLVIAKPCA